MSKLMFAHGLLGSKHLARMICISAKITRSDTLILLGDTVSPSILKWLVQHCGLRVLGVLGRYDNAALASELRRINGLIECKTVKIGEIVLYGYGFPGCHPQITEHIKVDILVSSLPGLKYTCCNKCSDIVDLLIDRLSARLTVIGGCEYPCIDERTFSPGSVQRDYIGLIDATGNSIEARTPRLADVVNSFIDRFFV
ncbi:MAG: hypothetical protein QXE81_05510 [Desulfurococcaceae archaeon]